MDTLLQEIYNEKERKEPEKGYIQRLQQLSDKGKGDKVAHNVFVSTGRIYTKKSYLKKYGTRQDELNPKTQCVLVYMLGYKLDMLTTGEYYFETKRGEEVTKYINKSAKTLEHELYDIFRKES